MGFAPIRLEDYVRDYLKRNRGSSKAEVTSRLKKTLEAFHAGALCSCGNPIWVIGSAEVGHMCFTCITGEADPSQDYELSEACGTHGRKRTRPGEHKRRPNILKEECSKEPRRVAEAESAEPLDISGTDEDVPF